MNINFNLSNKASEIKVKNMVGVFLESSELSMLGKLLIVHEDRETSSDTVVAHREGIYRGCSYSIGNLCRI